MRREHRDERRRWGSRRARETLVKAPLIIVARSRVYQAVYKYDRWPRGNTSPWISRCNLCADSESETGRKSRESEKSRCAGVAGKRTDRTSIADQFAESVHDGNDLTTVRVHRAFPGMIVSRSSQNCKRDSTADEARIIARMI